MELNRIYCNSVNLSKEQQQKATKYTVKKIETRKASWNETKRKQRIAFCNLFI